MRPWLPFAAFLASRLRCTMVWSLLIVSAPICRAMACLLVVTAVRRRPEAGAEPAQRRSRQIYRRLPRVVRRSMVLLSQVSDPPGFERRIGDVLLDCAHEDKTRNFRRPPPVKRQESSWT